MSSYFEPGRGDAIKIIDGVKVRGGYRYDFQLYGQRHRSPRGYSTKRDSEDAEDALRRRLMQERAGIVVAPLTSSSPRFANWGGVYSTWVHSRHALGLLKRPDAIDVNISSVLRFWGEKPTTPGAYVHATAPYHNLTLEDPIRDSSWIRRFDEWMTSEGLAGDTRNHYNTTLRRMYWLAMQAEYRDEAGAPIYNPFQDRPRYKWKRRTATLTPAQIVNWIAHASQHTRLALSIATLNPKFRLANIVQLEWSDVNFDTRLIRVWDHKNDDSGKALVSALPAQLVEILEHARARHPNATRVILYRGRPVKTIDESVKSAAIAAGLKWGRFVKDGVTFHSLRHSASTLLARLGASADRRKDVTGHADLTMELWYTHLFPEDERALTETLSDALPIKEAAMQARSRAARPKKPAARKTAARRPMTGTQKPSAGGLLSAGGLPGGLTTRKVAISDPSGAQSGLRRGPQKRPSTAVSR